jgi:integrase
MATKIKSAESLEELELNKLLKYLSQNEHWVYYLLVRVGVSTALRFSDLFRIKWGDVLCKKILSIADRKLVN